MNMKRWSAVAAAGFGLMLLCDLLRELGLLSRMSSRGLTIAGAIVFFGGMIGLIVYSSKHPPLRCPACGVGLHSRHLRQPGGGLRLTGKESVQCPRCGAMFHPQLLHRDLK